MARGEQRVVEVVVVLEGALHLPHEEGRRRQHAREEQAQAPGAALGRVLGEELVDRAAHRIRDAPRGAMRAGEDARNRSVCHEASISQI